MRKIICKCGCASFSEKVALFDTTDKSISNQITLQKRYYAYQCDGCKVMYTEDDIELLVIGNIDPETNEPFNKRQVTLDHDLIKVIREQGVGTYQLKQDDVKISKDSNGLKAGLPES